MQEKNAGGTVTDTITRTYDDLDRLTQEVTAQWTLNYTYDNASRRTTMTVVGQPQVVYTYDNANRLTQIQQGTSTVTIGYDDADRRTSVTYPNTNSITYAYNAASELTSLTYKQGATTLGTLTYTYDLAGNRLTAGGTFVRSNIPPALTTTNYNEAGIKGSDLVLCLSVSYIPPHGPTAAHRISRRALPRHRSRQCPAGHLPR